MLDSGVGFVFIPGLHDLDKHLLRSPWHRGTGHPRLSCPCSARALLHRKQAEAVSAGWVGGAFPPWPCYVGGARGRPGCCQPRTWTGQRADDVDKKGTSTRQIISS